MYSVYCTGKGQEASMELVHVEGGVAEHYPDELPDYSAQHLIRFEPLNPFTYMQRAITVKNPT